MFKLIESNGKEMKEVLGNGKVVWASGEDLNLVNPRKGADYAEVVSYNLKRTIQSGVYEVFVETSRRQKIKASIDGYTSGGAVEPIIRFDVMPNKRNEIRITLPRFPVGRFLAFEGIKKNEIKNLTFIEKSN